VIAPLTVPAGLWVNETGADVELWDGERLVAVLEDLPDARRLAQLFAAARELKEGCKLAVEELMKVTGQQPPGALRARLEILALALCAAVAQADGRPGDGGCTEHFHG
jgi:hypothetical protein